MSEAFKADDLQSAREAYKEWQASQCYHPQTQKIVDGHTGELRSITIPCGKCYHCRESHINEWVTRMYAHCEDFANVYFVTLTYRSFDSNLREVSQLMLDKLSQAVWHVDAYNETKHLAYSPCLLCKDHYQKFLKRLRTNTGITDLTYCLAGEYGKKYGRPHFHLILFTNSTLTKRDIDRAWSVALFHDGDRWRYKTNQKNGKTRYFSIGRTQFDDLVRNGTLNTAAKVKVDGNYMNAAHCFSYVCKYVCKNDDYNRLRVDIAYQNLFKKQKFTKIYNDSVPAERVQQYLTFTNTNYNLEQYNALLNRYTYEETLFQPSKSIWTGNLKFEKWSHRPGLEVLASFIPSILSNVEIKDDHFRTSLFASFRPTFVEQFAPFVEFSRGTPIGCLYAKRHLSEFTQGVFNRPIMQTQGFVVPRYFFTKAAEFLYGLRCVSPTLKGVSYTLSNLPDLYGRFEKFLCDASTPVSFKIDSTTHQNLGVYLKSPYSFFDKSTGEHVLLLKYGDSIRVEMFKYDRHLRSYYFTRSVPLYDWLDTWLARIEVEMLRYYSKRSATDESARLQSRAFSLAASLGFDLTTEQNLFESNQADYLASRQRIYDATHASCE